MLKVLPPTLILFRKNNGFQFQDAVQTFLSHAHQPSKQKEMKSKHLLIGTLVEVKDKECSFLVITDLNICLGPQNKHISVEIQAYKD